MAPTTLVTRAAGRSAGAGSTLAERISEVEQVDGQMKVTLTSQDTDPSFLAETLVNGGARVTGLWEEELGLEEVFMRVTRGETQ